MDMLMFIFITILAFIFQFIDASIGMGYGTILSPILLCLGFNPIISVPAVLFSQAMGSFAASRFHIKYGNSSFPKGSSSKNIIITITTLGILATISAAFISFQIPKNIISIYIGLLVICMGIVLFIKKQFKISHQKMLMFSILSSFNKGISAGGFGPIMTSGLIISGENSKQAIGTTTLAESPICIASFLTYVFINLFKTFSLSEILQMNVTEFGKVIINSSIMNWELLFALVLGSVLIAPFAAKFTQKVENKYINIMMGILMLFIGSYTLYKVIIKMIG
jgi:uncharacterized membrane protein YfcA